MKARIVFLFPIVLLFGIITSCDLLGTSRTRQGEVEAAGNAFIIDIVLLAGQSTTVRLDDYPDHFIVEAEYDSSIVIVQNLQEALTITLLREIDEPYDIDVVASDSNGQTLRGTVRLMVFEDLEQDFEVELAPGAWGTITLADQYPGFAFVRTEHDSLIVFVQFLGWKMDVRLWAEIEEPYVFNYQAINSSTGQQLSGGITVIPSL